MILKSLSLEFEHEVNSTRKLLQSVPEKDLAFKPSEVSWNMGELAQHIATIYYWFIGVCNQDEYDIASDTMVHGAPDDLNATLELFERNVEKARSALQSLTEERLKENWTMKVGDKIVLGPTSRIGVVRGFLYNHIYHHRGEMIVYLRSTGNKVPGMYGPTFEES